MNQEAPPVRMRLACSLDSDGLFWPDRQEERLQKARSAEPVAWASLVAQTGALLRPKSVGPATQAASTGSAAKSEPIGLSSVSP
jgi:hypothetical protein